MTIQFNLFNNSTNVRRFRAGETLFTQGEPGDEMFVVREGEVRIFVEGVELEQVTSGGIFGEMSLIDQTERAATAIAITDVEVVSVNKRQFEFMVQQTPNFALTVMRIMSERVRARAEMIVNRSL